MGGLVGGIPAPIAVAVLDLNKLAKLFYQAAFWLARAQNTHVVMSSAFGRGTWGDRARVGVAEFFTGWQYQPEMASLDADRALIMREADRIAKLMVNEYLERLFMRSPQAAHAYARSVFAKQNLAIRQVQEINNQEAEQNQLTGAFAGMIARGLDDTIVACEVALAVGTLFLGVGGVLAPALFATATAGMSADGIAVAGLAISQGYGFLSKAVTVNSVSEVKAVAISMAGDSSIGLSTAGYGYLGDRMKTRAEKAEKIADATHDAAKAKVHQLNKRLAGKMSFLPRQITKADRWSATRQMNHAAADVQRARSTIRVGGAGATVFPLIQFGVDILSTASGHTSRRALLGPN